MRKVLSVVLALGVVVAACVWVSAVRVNDRYTDCGTPLHAARHGQTVPRIFVSPTPAEQKMLDSGDPVSMSGGLVTVCRDIARERIAISALAIVIAVGGAVLLNRRWGRGEPPPPESLAGSPAVAS